MYLGEMDENDPIDNGRDNHPQEEGQAQEDGDDVVLNQEDIVEVIDLGEEPPGEDLVADEIGEMDLDPNNDEGMEEGAEGIQPPRDDAKLVFSKHTGSVFCVDVDPRTSSLVVTGGEDDKAFVWNASSGEVLIECTGHKDSLTCAKFCHDSSFVATGDMAGLIKVWNVATKQEIWSFEVTDLEWLDWHFGSHVLMAGTLDGSVWMWKIPSGDCKTYQTHGCACNIGQVMPDGKRLCAGYEDGIVKVWDLKAGTAIHTFTGHLAHQSSITSMDCHSDNTLVLTGSTDVTAKLLNTATAKVIATFNCSSGTQGGQEDESVEAVGFCKVQPMFATGTLGGQLNLWETSTQQVRHQCKHEAGIVRLKWASDAPVLYTCSIDGAVYLWDARSGKLEQQWFGHTAEVLDMDLSRDGNLIVSVSGDNTARVYSLHTPDR